MKRSHGVGRRRRVIRRGLLLRPLLLPLLFGCHLRGGCDHPLGGHAFQTPASTTRRRHDGRRGSEMLPGNGVSAFVPSPRRPFSPASPSPSTASTTTRSTSLAAAPPDFLSQLSQLPFDELSRQLSDALDIGADFLSDSDNLSNGAPSLLEAETSIVLESVGHDLLVFLSSSVVVTLASTSLGFSPILGYLFAGALLGPHGFDVFSNAKADVELGDFGILFLLFSEGLEVSSLRLKKLSDYLPLGFAQISLTTGVITAAILLGAPQFLDRLLPLDEGFIDITNPTEAVVLALAGTLSTSAFIFPVLKERGWENDNAGQAATSILLLQDLFVAPLLVVMPFVVGQGPVDFAAIGFLTAKAAIGFGLVMYLGSLVLEQFFAVVARTRSTETFVALSLLVSVGMGTAAKGLGLTDTAGAFAAGVLLANTSFRAQIQADVLPFKGILLGIFFMDAGSLFDSDLVLTELPTVLTGAASLILLKALTVAAATRVPRWMEPNRLEAHDAVKLAFLLSGGGEFAFVVLALAEKLEVLPKDLGGLLTAIVLITMAVTPLLGQVAAAASGAFESGAVNGEGDASGGTPSVEESQVAEDAVVICGYGEVGQEIVSQLGLANYVNGALSVLPRVVAFDTDPALIDTILMPESNAAVMYGDGENPEVLRSHGVEDPTAIFVSYEDHERALAATFRLRTSFDRAPIYTRAQTREEAQELKCAGATEVVVERDELPRSSPYLLLGDQERKLNGDTEECAMPILNLLDDAERISQK
eukprot:CAMPEP_0172534232 /NCGR_PEP_ID=MMETSP1067-20121228/6676_1 /TAXON_ID=265564 ORGANISM="Thalassiosira punctigera, Strain Tpunct2005C2" /NCGR_SAMPLE_ID=MMETSP1067 /ASSEMBLY_ACC=CAM_ASM_000444 /LENGTH=759 /DNA_ID=CAMNT_0013319005 /DNA_START=187 /DNA_END=2466 /DNA_ORIENTATION=-